MTVGPGPAPKAAKAAEEQLRRIAMAFPETREDHPWGHSAFKVKNKAFVFLGVSELGLSVSVKLPESRYEALELPFCEPTHYGLGKSGWVTASFGPHLTPPIELMRPWIEESYRAIAPRKLVGQLDGAPTAGASPPAKKRAAPAARARVAAAKKPASKPAGRRNR